MPFRLAVPCVTWRALLPASHAECLLLPVVFSGNTVGQGEPQCRLPSESCPPIGAGYRSCVLFHLILRSIHLKSCDCYYLSSVNQNG